MRFFIAYYLLLLPVIFGSYFFVGSGFHEWYVFGLSVLSLIHMLLFDLAARKLFPRRGLFCISTLFLISYGIVFFQFSVLAPFYEEIRYSSLLWAHDEFVNWTTMIAAGSIHLFMAGYGIGFLKVSSERKIPRLAVASREKIRVLLYTFPIVSIVCFLIFMGLVGKSYLSGAYGGSANWGGGASHFFRLFEVFFYLTIALEIYKIKILKPSVNVIQYIMAFNIHTLGFIAFFFLFHLFTGDRGPIITAGLMLVGGYDFLFKRLPILISVAAIAVGAFSLSFISLYRTKDSSLTMEERIEKGKEKQNDKKFYEITGDLASSVRIMNYATMMTPNISDYYFGWIQAGRVATAIPFASSFFNRALPIRVHHAPLGASSSSIFTYYVLGPSASIGVGSSILADLYIDFGILGCFVVMLIFGYFIAWTEVRAGFAIGLFQVVFYLIVVSGAVYWPRSFIGVNFQRWFLVMMILYLIHKYFLGNKKVVAYHHLEQSR